MAMKNLFILMMMIIALFVSSVHPVVSVSESVSLNSLSCGLCLAKCFRGKRLLGIALCVRCVPKCIPHDGAPAPAPTPYLAPSVAPAPATTPYPSPSVAPAPATTPYPSPSVAPAPATTPYPAPSVAPAPATTPYPSPSVAPAPATTPYPAPSVAPAPPTIPNSAASVAFPRGLSLLVAITCLIW